MASKLERIGTIFSRITSLIKGGVVHRRDVPIWYEVYEAFPPKYEPCFDRPILEKSLTKIFYDEDFARAKFHEKMGKPSPVHLESTDISSTQKFLLIYLKYRKAGHSQTSSCDMALKEYKGVSSKTISTR